MSRHASFVLRPALALSVLVSAPLWADDAYAGPPNWFELMAPVARSQVESHASFSEKHAMGGFRQDRSGNVSGTLALGQYVALQAGGGYAERRRTDTETARIRERWNGGVRLAFAGGYDDGRPAFGFGIHVFDRPADPAEVGVDPELFLARALLALGMRMGPLDLTGELRLQTETNRAMREEEEQEFRRHYGFGLGLAWRTTEKLRLVLESRYVIPYDPKIDTDVRSFRAFPGIVVLLGSGWELQASLVLAVRVERDLDRGFRFGVNRRL